MRLPSYPTKRSTAGLLSWAMYEKGRRNVIDPGDKREVLALLAERQLRVDAAEAVEAEKRFEMMKREDPERWIVEHSRYMRRLLAKLHASLRAQGLPVLPPDNLAEIFEGARKRHVEQSQSD